MRLNIYSLVFLSAVFMSGCSMLNPFASNFKCPNMVDGKCQPISQSYKNSLSDTGSVQQQEAEEKAGLARAAAKMLFRGTPAMNRDPKDL